MTTKSQTRITGVRTVIIPVSDQDRSLEFYVEKLGFEVRADTPYGEGRWIEVAPPGAETTISIVLPGAPDPREPGGFVPASLATDDVDATHAELQSRGVEVEEVIRMGDPVPPMFFFKDPDGNRLLIVERD